MSLFNLFCFNFSDVSAMNSALDLVANTSASLKSSATQLETELRDTRNELERIKSQCNGAMPSACDSIDTAGLRQVANFSNLPSVDDELKNIRDIVGQNFSGSVNDVSILGIIVLGLVVCHKVFLCFFQNPLYL